MQLKLSLDIQDIQNEHINFIGFVAGTFMYWGNARICYFIGFVYFVLTFRKTI